MNERLPTPFHRQIVDVIKRVPRGKVVTYGQVAILAGNPRGARQVVWALNSSWEKENLPWHRVVNAKGKISLPHHGGYELQKSLLEAEGVAFGRDDTINLDLFQWRPR